MTQAQTVADLKDTGVTVAPEAVVNDILPFCAQGQEGRDLLPRPTTPRTCSAILATSRA